MTGRESERGRETGTGRATGRDPHRPNASCLPIITWGTRCCRDSTTCPTPQVRLSHQHVSVSVCVRPSGKKQTHPDIHINISMKSLCQSTESKRHFGFSRLFLSIHFHEVVRCKREWWRYSYFQFLMCVKLQKH